MLVVSASYKIIRRAPRVQSRARFCKPFMEPRNRFPAWRNRFLGSINVTNMGSDFRCKGGGENVGILRMTANTSNVDK
jgi:hypothetical protein